MTSFPSPTIPAGVAAPVLTAIAESVGTPAYVYDAAEIRRAYTSFDRALGRYPHAIHYALKANSTLALVRLLRQLGSEVDANSGGEIEVALRAGFIPEQIVFSGVGKGGDELDRIAARAQALGTTVRVALRVNPDIDARSHPHISTGLKTNKFGTPIGEARQVYRDHARLPGLEPVGVHVHVGSQITALDPLRDAAARVVALAKALAGDGIALEHIDLGGGLGVSYDGSAVPTAEDYAAAILPALEGSGFDLVVEPGRALIAAAGILLARVVDRKASAGGPQFVVLDAGMTELMRPALYGAFHRIVAVTPRPGAVQRYEVVGPLCESSDIFGRDRELPPLDVGDLVAILDAGAYGSVMASTYNRRPFPPEVLVDGDSWRVIRRRQTIDDLLALEE